MGVRLERAGCQNVTWPHAGAMQRRGGALRCPAAGCYCCDHPIGSSVKPAAPSLPSRPLTDPAGAPDSRARWPTADRRSVRAIGRPHERPSPPLPSSTAACPPGRLRAPCEEARQQWIDQRPPLVPLRGAAHVLPTHAAPTSRRRRCLCSCGVACSIFTHCACWIDLQG